MYKVTEIFRFPFTYFVGCNIVRLHCCVQMVNVSEILLFCVPMPGIAKIIFLVNFWKYVPWTEFGNSERAIQTHGPQKSAVWKRILHLTS